MGEREYWTPHATKDEKGRKIMKDTEVLIFILVVGFLILRD